MENNKEKEIDLLAIASGVWAKKRKVVKWGLVGLVVGIVIAFSIPKEYKSTIKLASESKSKSGQLAQFGGMASMMGINLGGTSTNGLTEAVYPVIVASTPFINEFSSIPVTYKGEQMELKDYLIKNQKRAWWSYVISAPIRFFGWLFSGESTGEVQLENPKNPSEVSRAFQSILASRIAVDIDKKTKLIVLDVKMQDPSIALIVADSLHSKLIRYMTDYYTAKSRNDLRNSEDMLIQARRDYYKSDSLYAITRDRNQNLITQSSQIKVERHKQERDLAFMVYQQLAQQVESNKITLQQETPIATIIEPACVPNKSVSPNKMMIIFALTFLGVFAAVGMIVVRKLAGKAD